MEEESAEAEGAGRLATPSEFLCEAFLIIGHSCLILIHFSGRWRLPRRQPRDLQESRHFCCTSAASLLHFGCTSAAPRLHLGCTSAAPRLHLVCTAAAPRLHCGCTSAAAPLSRGQACGDRRRIARGQRLGWLHVAALDRVDMASVGGAVDVSQGSLSCKPRCRLELPQSATRQKMSSAARVRGLSVSACRRPSVLPSAPPWLQPSPPPPPPLPAASRRVRVLLVLHVLVTLLNERGVNHQRAVPSAARRGLG